MNERLEKLFEELAENSIRLAEKIPCSHVEFLEGLRDMRSALDERISIEVSIGDDDEEKL